MGAPVGTDLDRDEPAPVTAEPAGAKRSVWAWMQAHPVLVVGVLLALLVLPLVVALVVLHDPRWFPILDMSETELRVRDVASSHPPLIGLAGRIGPFGPNGGSHPGPISFYALWPVWELFGASSFGLQAGTVALDAIAVGLCLWMAYRRGGLYLAVGMTAVLSVLMRAYGAFLLTLPWNPYLPVLWWMVFVLASWSVLDDDFAMLPVWVVAGTMCVQTHISYLGLVGGLTFFVIAALVYSAIRRRDAIKPRTLLKWSVVAVILTAVLWTPPVIDQFVHTPGNLSTIRDYFGNPPDAPIGLHSGVDALLTQLDPVKLLTHTLVRDDQQVPVSGSRLPGVLLLLVWAGSVAGAWRLRRRRLLLLDAVLGVALVLGVASAARIFGEVFFYLLLWAWGLAALMLFTIGWTVWEFVGARVDAPRAATLAQAGVAALLTLTVVVTSVFVNSAAHVDVQSPRINASLAALSPPTVAKLEALARTGEHGPFLVTWLPDPQAIGSEGYGLLDELDRNGFDVRASDVFRPGATRFHIIDPARARMEVHLATGPLDIAHWRADSRYTEVAYYDPRSESERAEFDRLRNEVIAQLRAAGLDARVAQVDDNLFMLGLAPEVPDSARQLISRMLALGMPSAVFVGPSSSRN